MLWNFTAFKYMSDSPQVKHNLIYSKAKFTYETPQELSNDLNRGILEIEKILKNCEIGWGHSLVSGLSRNNALRLKVKESLNLDEKVL